MSWGCSSPSQPADDDDDDDVDAPPGPDTDGRPAIDAGVDAPIDGAEVDDCDPDGPIHPGADETIDGLDNDCDGLIDEVSVCGSGGADFAAIGPAIAAAPAGGTIFVCGGTYNERLTIAKPLEIIGSGAATTVLDAGGAGTAITVTGTGGPAPVIIRGFTIRNGRTPNQGAGISCTTSALQLIDSTVTANVATLGGGGLHATSCALTITATRFEQNDGGQLSVSSGGGGGLLVTSTGEIRDSHFISNVAVNGGGLAITEGSVAVLTSNFGTNRGTLRGGGIYSNSDSLIAGNSFIGNDAPLTGGGLHIVAHAPMVRDNVIRGNHSENDGGGIYFHQGNAVFLLNHVVDNVSDDDGGGIRVFEGQTRIESNLIEGNYAADGGGGLRISHVPATLIDNIVRNNTAGNTGGGMDLDNDASLVRGGEIYGNEASSGGGIFAWLAPWIGLRLENIHIYDNNAWRGGGIFLDDNFTPVTMTGLTIEDNTANYGAGLMVRATNYTITHSLFLNNRAATRGGAILAGVPSQTSGWPHPCPPCPPTDPIGTIAFVTFHGNTATGGSALWTDSPGTRLTNSILSENSAPQVKVEAPVATGVIVPPMFRYNDVMPPSFVGMADPTGTEGNLGVTPLFMDVTTGDFHLQSTSQCVNAADPAMLDADGSRADMGMFGGVL